MTLKGNSIRRVIFFLVAVAPLLVLAAQAPASRVSSSSCSTTALRVERRMKTGRIPVSIAAGDFNRDGKRDLVVANSGSDNVSVYLGDGKGDFADAVNFGTGKSPRAVTVGDLNSDGLTDIVVANYNSNSVTLILGANNGRFTPGPTLDVGSGPVSLALGDFNRDGN